MASRHYSTRLRRLVPKWPTIPSQRSILTSGWLKFRMRVWLESMKSFRQRKSCTRRLNLPILRESSKAQAKAKALATSSWKTFVRLMRSCMSSVHLTTKISRTFLIRSIRWTISTRSTWNLFWPILNPSTNVMRALKRLPALKKTRIRLRNSTFCQKSSLFWKKASRFAVSNSTMMSKKSSKDCSC